MLFLILSTEGCKISCACLQSTHCLPWIHINIGGWEERETYLFGSMYRSTTYFKLGRMERGRLQAYTLLVWRSSFLKIFVFQGKDEITLLKQKLSLCTPTELLTSIHFISCSCGPVKHIIHQRYEEKSVAKKKTTIIAFPGSVLQIATSL